MIRNNELKDLSYEFAKDIVYLCNELDKKRVYVVGKQLLKSGTSIGANVREAVFAQSTADFYTKLKIAEKEAGETEYWLDLVHDTALIDDSEFEKLHNKLVHITVLLAKTMKTLKERHEKL